MQDDPCVSANLTSAATFVPLPMLVSFAERPVSMAGVASSVTSAAVVAPSTRQQRSA